MNKPPQIAPFCGVHYNPEKTNDFSEVVAPPYDVISPERQEELYQSSPHNVIRLILGKQGDQDTDTDSRYTRAASDWQSWQQDEVLIQDTTPTLYVYHQEFEVKGVRVKRKGFLALKRLEDFKEGGVKPHEKTLEGPKADRLKLTQACGANFSPIFGLYGAQSPRINELMSLENKEVPFIDVQDPDGVRHCLWKVQDPAIVKEIIAAVSDSSILIADGHHRYETALNYRKWMNENHAGQEPTSHSQYVLMYFADMADPGMLVFPTHRLLHNWSQFEWQQFLNQCREVFEVEVFRQDHKDDFLAALADESGDGHIFGVVSRFDSKRFYLLRLGDQQAITLAQLQDVEEPLKKLDAGILHHLILRKFLGMTDEEQRDPEFVTFLKEEKKGWSRVNDEGVNCLFLMQAPKMAQIQEVAEAGLIMPPKTTYFYPKLLSGLVFNKIDPKGHVVIP
jgi:uncharacterized protein (DUF1015 family)